MYTLIAYFKSHSMLLRYCYKNMQHFHTSTSNVWFYFSDFELIERRKKTSFRCNPSSCSRPPRLRSVPGLCRDMDRTFLVSISGCCWLFYEKLRSELLPVEWSTGPPPLLLNRAMYRSGYAFSRATHRSRKWSLSLFISIFRR